MDRSLISRRGLVFISIYLLLYGGFMWLNVGHPEIMEKPLFLGINVALAYGLFLIVIAFFFALSYALFPPKRKK